MKKLVLVGLLVPAGLDQTKTVHVPLAIRWDYIFTPLETDEPESTLFFRGFLFSALVQAMLWGRQTSL